MRIFVYICTFICIRRDSTFQSDVHVYVNVQIVLWVRAHTSTCACICQCVCTCTCTFACTGACACNSHHLALFFFLLFI